MPTDHETHETNDIYLAAYLVHSGCSMTTKRNGHRTIFVFTNPGGSIMDLRQAYVTGTARVPPHEYAMRVMAMKSLCFDQG